MSWRKLDPQGRLHFAPDAVAAVAKASGQELGSHTFSHICFREAGCRAEDVLADSNAVAKAFRDKFGHAPTSFVFPRNQVSQTEALRQAGIERWRTNPRVSCWNATRRAEQSRQALEALGYPVQWHAYPMPHSVCPQEIGDISAFLGRIL